MSDFVIGSPALQFTSGNLTQEQTVQLLRELMIQSQGAIIQSALTAEITFFLIGLTFGAGVVLGYHLMWKKFRYDPLVGRE